MQGQISVASWMGEFLCAMTMVRLRGTGGVPVTSFEVCQNPKLADLTSFSIASHFSEEAELRGVWSGHTRPEDRHSVGLA